MKPLYILLGAVISASQVECEEEEDIAIPRRSYRNNWSIVKLQIFIEIWRDTTLSKNAKYFRTYLEFEQKGRKVGKVKSKWEQVYWW